MIRKLLIANRGEIARRIIRTCRRLGVRTVAVASEPDRTAPFAEEADEVVPLEGKRALETYLDVGRLLAAASERGCDGVHPGYGFLSENAEFARLVAEAGLVFVGPPPEAIALLGDKMASKRVAMSAGVPPVPGPDAPAATAEEALRDAREVGLPALLKPAGGGGGRGMRVVRSLGEVEAAFAAARAEARKGFGDDRIFVERYVERPRHIEFQVLADAHGAVVHLGERECSLQRRHQKVIEESPSVALGHPLRRRMGEAACALASAAGYANAGTVEFILDGEGRFYFLEMNTRLQVEHPVTELVTGLDLVELQLRVASGEPLPFGQADVAIRGWAMEARICAEDPERGFLPMTGLVTRYSEPRGVRVDSGVRAGSSVSVYYDSLLAKVAAWGEDRERARRALSDGLDGFHLEGVTTNVDFANALLNHPAFAAGDLSTSFVEEHFAEGRSRTPPPQELLRLMAIAALEVFHNRRALERSSLRPMSPQVGGERAEGPVCEYVVRVDDLVLPARLERGPSPVRWLVSVGESRYEVETPEFEFYRRRLRLTVDGEVLRFRLRYQVSHIEVSFRGLVRLFEVYLPKEWLLQGHMHRRSGEASEPLLRCPMPGLVSAVHVSTGALVRRGQPLVRLESMKMETELASPMDGVVDRVAASVGQPVEKGDALVFFRS